MMDICSYIVDYSKYPGLFILVFEKMLPLAETNNGYIEDLRYASLV